MNLRELPKIRASVEIDGYPFIERNEGIIHERIDPDEKVGIIYIRTHLGAKEIKITFFKE